jgi:hypothetical protein
MDPKFTKYPGFSPYNYCANTPFIIIDKYGEDLIVFGSDQSFLKFKAVLESQFHGLIEIKRDENNKVIMHVRETEALASGSIGVDKQVITNIIEAQKKKEAFIQLDKIISDNCITNVNLVDDDPYVKGGCFRECEIEGSTQIIDVGDAYIRKDWTFANGAGAIIHELVEAHEDQVVNGSKNVKNEVEFNKEFLKSHIPALEAQAKVSGFDKQINQKRDNQIVQVFNMKIKTNEKGLKTESWVLTEYKYEGENKAPVIIRSGVHVKDVKTSQDNTQVISYKEE